MTSSSAVETTCIPRRQRRPSRASAPQAPAIGAAQTQRPRATAPPGAGIFFSMLLAGVKSYYRSKRTCATHIKRTCAACSCGGARAVRPRHTTPIVHNCALCTIAHRSTLWSAPIVHTLCTHCAHIVRTLWSTAPLSIFFTASVSAGGVAAAASPKEDAPIPASNISFQRVKPSPNNPAEIP